MIDSLPKLLNLSGEAALYIGGAVIRYANPAACALLGRSLTGMNAAELFGEELTGSQSANLIADITVNARRFTGRFSRQETGWLVFLTGRRGGPDILNDPLLFSLRSSLMNMGIAAESLRGLCEKQGGEALRRSTASLTNSYFRILRQVDNAGFALSYFRGEPLLNAVSCDLERLCRGAAEAIQPFFPDVTLEYAGEGGHGIVADPALFKLLLNNLLANCLLHAACSFVRIRLSETPQSILLSVTDDGCGIPPERLHQTFERYRYPFDATQMGMGPGLGMSVARGVAELHGGTLLLESRVNRGTAVRVSFSRSLRCGILRADESSLQYTAQDLLAGLADCLPESAFAENYLD